MSIRDKMRPLFRTLDGGLFSEKKRERQTWEMRCPSSKRRAAP